ncbi:MAG TPA: metallophosphoesterase [Candidatus Polarisedimenticolaceae bacterium]|nr:metallophosphoesterase [Candidatus Polarisedimenticolaceae bacterium]
MRRRVLAPPVHAALDPPHPAAPTPRAHFDPKQGWFRKIERATSLFLSRHIWQLIPGMRIPYGVILSRYFTVSEAEVPVPGLPAAFDRLRVLFVSDIHAGPFLSRDLLWQVVDELAGLHADVVIHGGDIATSNVREVAAHVATLMRLRAPLGVYGVLGNHDHYTHDLDGLTGLLESCGVRMLDNTAVALERDGARIALAGIDDWNVGAPDLPGALAEAARVAPGAPVILASHNPDAFFDAAARGVSLVLSGHTHGGQVRIPGRPVFVRMSRYRLDEGRYYKDAAQLIVSRGVGVSGIPLRLWCSPEVLLVTLRK